MMRYSTEGHHRHSSRLKGYDYSQAGGYFITLVSEQRECLFGSIVDQCVVLSDFGKIVEEEWLRSTEIRKEILLDDYVVMPNHFHAVVFIQDAEGNKAVGAIPDVGATSIVEATGRSPLRGAGWMGISEQSNMKRAEGRRMNDMTEATAITGATGRSPLPEGQHRPVGPGKHSLGSLVGGFKSACTVKINVLRDAQGTKVWQRNYYEHVLRNEDELLRARAYIRGNPARWQDDEEFIFSGEK